MAPRVPATDACSGGKIGPPVKPEGDGGEGKPPQFPLRIAFSSVRNSPSMSGRDSA